MLNRCSAVYGDAAIAAMSIVARVINFLFCVSLGIAQGFQPVSAFNYGARKYSRVKEAFRVSVCSCLMVMTVTAAIGLAGAGTIIAAFRDDADVIAIGKTALRMQCVSLFMMPISMCGNNLFQSIGRSLQATFLASIRSGLVFIPVLLILSRCFGLFGIQVSQAVADVVAAAINVPLVLRLFRSLPEDGCEIIRGNG
ncbi:MAG: hypothetical protein LUE65_09330 [Clostridiales bacterium]|nr:hypothetical protein [Clostridiales bacterium]